MVGLDPASGGAGETIWPTLTSPPDWTATELLVGSVADVLRMIEIGEIVHVVVALPVVAKDDAEEEEKEPCRRIYLHAFRGDRSDEGVRAFKQSLRDNEAKNGKGPTGTECLLYTGHVGISFNAMSPVYGFNPDTGDTPGWKVIAALKAKTGTHAPYPGVVTDDTAAFRQAKSRELEYKVVEYVYPKSKYEEIKAKFKEARKSTGLTYSFPGQGGDCNCATWPGRIGIAIPSSNGNMRAYMQPIGTNDVRKEGDCEDG